MRRLPDTDALIEDLYRLHGRPLLRYLYSGVPRNRALRHIDVHYVQ